MIIPSQPPSAVIATAGASSNGLAATNTLQHCISRTATSTALIAIVVIAADAISDQFLMIDAITRLSAMYRSACCY
jgi:hypothetical protein